MPTNNPADHTAQDRATETLFSEMLMGILELLPALPRHEREELLHHVKCSLAEFNRMYAQAYFTNDDDQAGAFAALRAHGFEPTIACTFGEDDGLPPMRCVEIHGVSALRQNEFFWWATHLLEPFGGHVEEAGYADPPGPDAKRPTDH